MIKISANDEGPYFHIEGEMEDMTNVACEDYPLYTYEVNRAFRHLRLWVESKITGKLYPAVQYFGLE